MTCARKKRASRRSPKPEDLVGTLTRYLEYFPETGEILIKTRRADDFQWHKNPQAYADWFNATKAGKSAYMSPYPNGYQRVACCGQSYLGHRVAWILATGAEPNGVIDHINGNRTDNRRGNLRDVTHSQNSANHGIFATSQAGITGISYRASLNRWVVGFTRNGKPTPKRWFRTKEDAVAYRLSMGNLPRDYMIVGQQ